LRWIRFGTGIVISKAAIQTGVAMTRIGIKIAAASLVFVGALSFLALAGARQSWVYHLTVDQYLSDPQYATQRVRLCGVVVKEKCIVDPAALTASFVLKGTSATVPVTYHGTIPDLFAPGRDVEIEGRRDPAGIFQADVLMTKCASKYESKTGGAS
jgi:cytochrome c-type biogenesis protein CcmE